ncbi:MAG: YraN family protein [Oscillospiraceae bacterium]|nr:YraN family protein [Oscillospiraceae bacterium]
MREGESARLLGRWGEALAAQWLRRRRYRLLAAGYRCRLGEIDLIASSGKYICFIEVKLRKSADFAPAGQAVDHRKQHRLRQTALLYLADHPTPLQPRFDVIEIYAPEGTCTKNPQINHLKNAF